MCTCTTYTLYSSHVPCTLCILLVQVGNGTLQQNTQSVLCHGNIKRNSVFLLDGTRTRSQGSYIQEMLMMHGEDDVDIDIDGGDNDDRDEDGDEDDDGGEGEDNDDDDDNDVNEEGDATLYVFNCMSLVITCLELRRILGVVTEYSTEDFSPFPSKVSALLYMMLHAQRPIVRCSYPNTIIIRTLLIIIIPTQSEYNLKFMIFIMREVFPQTPSLAQLKTLKIPGYTPPKKVYSHNNNNYRL